MNSRIKNTPNQQEKSGRGQDIENEVSELKEIVTSLTTSISNLNDRMNYLETMITSGFNNLLIKLNNRDIGIESALGNDVEIDAPAGDEDSLTPQDILLLPDPLKATVKELLKLRITSAEEISRYTKKQRAVESSYLNQLVKRNYCRKIRIGRKIYFYIGSFNDLKPFEYLTTEFRPLMLTILRMTPSNIKELKFSIKELREEYIAFYKEEGETKEDLNKILDLASIKFDFISKDLNTETNAIKVIFNKDLWRKLKF